MKRASFAAFDIVLIDEASMINNELWAAARGNGAVHRCEDYFMGDAAQFLNEKFRPCSPKSATVTASLKLSVMWLKTGKLLVRYQGITETEKNNRSSILNVIALDSEWNATKDNRVYSLSDNDWVDGAIALSNLLSTKLTRYTLYLLD